MNATKLCRSVALLAAILLSPHAVGAADSQEFRLWPDDHPANKGSAPSGPEDPEWTTRVTTTPTLTAFIPGQDVRTGAACIVCPGGGYGGLAMEKEGREPAKWLLERGVAAFVLRYRCGGGENRHPIPLDDLQRAIRLVRSRADEFGVDVHRVAAWGFSAGGHLVSTAATHFDDGLGDSADVVARQSSRPDLQILLYPVISMEKDFTHGGSRQNLLGDSPSEDLVKFLSNDQQVTAKTPPAFLVHAADDDAVPVKNSLSYAAALAQAKVPCELHVYEAGRHGFGMLRGDRPADRWPTLLEPWLKSHGWIK